MDWHDHPGKRLSSQTQQSESLEPILGPLATIALSDHYDDIKITDFSQISHVYRLQKKQLRQNSEAVRRYISPVDPMPEEAPIPSLTRVIEAETWANSEA
jgi:hypothetical protein